MSDRPDDDHHRSLWACLRQLAGEECRAWIIAILVLVLITVLWEMWVG
ncbi:hypothetical protein [Pseudaestuariivita rosea]|nr:hypothetical protein [Pseudaestuariivita rosea]